MLAGPTDAERRAAPAEAAVLVREMARVVARLSPEQLARPSVLPGWDVARLALGLLVLGRITCDDPWLTVDGDPGVARDFVAHFPVP